MGGRESPALVLVLEPGPIGVVGLKITESPLWRRASRNRPEGDWRNACRGPEGIPLLLGKMARVPRGVGPQALAKISTSCS